MYSIRYSLEKYRGKSTRYHCPECHQRTFTRYIDQYTGQYLSEQTGRCNRVEKCGYHYTPKMYFEQHGNINNNYNTPLVKPNLTKQKPSQIDKKYLFQSLKSYDKNNLAIGLSRYFPKAQVLSILQKYYVGTSKGNKTIYWQVNRNNEVRTGKVMLYDQITLKRQGYINWVHSILQLESFNLKQVFFGSHLLTDIKTPVAIAEGEKNAILGALYYPQYNWIAVGSIEMLNVQKLNALKDYQITLFPDKGKAFIKWSKIAQESISDIKVNDVLERTDLNEGDDIADLVISVRKEQYQASKEVILDKFLIKNMDINNLIKRFDLKIIP